MVFLFSALIIRTHCSQTINNINSWILVLCCGKKGIFLLPKILRCYKKYVSNDIFSKLVHSALGESCAKSYVLFCVMKIDNHNFEKWLIMAKPIMVSTYGFLYYLLKEFGKISFQKWCKIAWTSFPTSFQFQVR